MEEFYNLKYKEVNHIRRQKLAEYLRDASSKDVFIPPSGSGVAFVVGDRDDHKNAVHSEPTVKCPRLFFSIMPMMKKDVEELKKHESSLGIYTTY